MKQILNLSKGCVKTLFLPFYIISLNYFSLVNDHTVRPDLNANGLKEQTGIYSAKSMVGLGGKIKLRKITLKGKKGLNKTYSWGEGNDRNAQYIPLGTN